MLKKYTEIEIKCAYKDISIENKTKKHSFIFPSPAINIKKRSELEKTTCDKIF